MTEPTTPQSPSPLLRRNSSKSIISDIHHSISQSLRNNILDEVKEDKRSAFYRQICSIRVKTLLVIGSLLTVLCIAFVAVLLGVFPNSFVQIEKKQAQQGMSRVMRSLYDQSKSVKNLLANNAGTQFSVDLMVSDPPDVDSFVNDNFPFANLMGMGMNYVAYYNLDGSMLFYTAWDLDTQQPLDYPTQLLQLIPGVTPLALNYTDPSYYASGVISFDGKLIMAVGSPIYNGSDTTYGYCIFAKILTPEVVNEMASSTQLCLTLINYNTSQPQSPVYNTYGSYLQALSPTVPHTQDGDWIVDQNSPVIVFDGNFLTDRECWSGQQSASGNVTTGNRVMNFVAVTDAFGNQAMVVRLDMVRATVAEGITAIVIAVVVLAFLLFLLIVCVLLFMEFFVLRKVVTLQHEITNITAGLEKDLRLRITQNSGKDELAQLTRFINSMLSSLENRNAYMKAILNRMGVQEQQSRATTNSIQDFVISCSMGGYIQTVNSSFLETLGYEASDVEGKMQITAVLRVSLDEIEQLGYDDSYPPIFIDTHILNVKGEQIPVTLLVTTVKMWISDEVAEGKLLSRLLTFFYSLCDHCQKQHREKVFVG
jgi:PAS domain S-box-containing protein